MIGNIFNRLIIYEIMFNSKSNRYNTFTFSKCTSGKLKVDPDILVNTKCFNINTRSHAIE